MQQVSARDIKMIPTTGGEADLATYLQVVLELFSLVSKVASYILEEVLLFEA